MIKLKYILYLLIVTGAFASCKHDDLTIAVPNENIRKAGDFIKNNYEMKLFSAALDKTGYTAELNESGPYTVLVPTDRAFNELGIYSPSDLNRINPDSLKRMIAYHILPRRLRLSDIPTNGVDVRYATLEGTELYTSLASTYPSGGAQVNDLYFSGSVASRKDVVIANGVIHVLDKVMKPNFSATIKQWLEQHPDYSVFVSGLKKFNLWEQLGTSNQFTVFAPDNNSLENVGITAESLAQMDTQKYEGDLLFGVYIMYDRHYFISDPQVFSIINSESRFNYFLKNNDHYMQFSSGKDYPDYITFYNLTLRTGSTIYDQVVKSVSSKLNAKNDNLCSNGLVHHLVDGLVTPDQAIKK